MKNIKKIVQEVYEGLENNNFATLDENSLKMWQPPLVGVAAGDDPIFDELKVHIGEFYWSPENVFELKYEKTDPSKLRVVSMVFPQSEEAKTDQQKITKFPSDKWLVSRGEWEPLMKVFSNRLVKRLEEEKVRSVSIDLLEEFHLEESENCGLASTWSHRHAAYAAGLGTFGLTDAIITEKGTAVRITSLVAEANFPVTERAYEGIYEWCLHFQGKPCGACIRRCPAGALDENGHDKDKCGDYEIYSERKLWPAHIKKEDYIFGCGICQAKIPCQNKRP